jgi:sugar phosphate isomerase/epimerase
MRGMNDSTPAFSRREFVRWAGMVPAVLAAPGLIGPTTTRAAVPAARSKYPIGIELYGVRGELARDLPGTLRRVAEIGYEVVEFYAPYFAWSLPYAKEVRARLDDLGLRCLSTHNHFPSFTPGETMAKAIELNQILGTRCLVLSSAPAGTTGVEGWKRLCGQLSAVVPELKNHGLTAGFHNHKSEWAKFGDERLMDIIAAQTPPEFVLQLDVGTCLEAGEDPVAWIKAHPGRIRSIHLKDWAPGHEAEEKGYRVMFAEGVAPWREIFAAAESVGGVEFYLMEQEGSRYSEFETAERCLATWRQLRGK